jgi:cytochrome bd-type quinol oxidase subunit 2
MIQQLTQRVSGSARTPRRMSGVGRVLVLMYGILALAATGRSVFQIIDRFDEAPVAFTLSGLSAAVYIVATIALLAPGRAWYRVAWITISFELAGVLIVGALSVLAPGILGLQVADAFGRDSTVWSVFGMGYLFIPLVLPILGMTWLAKHRPEAARS